MRSQIIRQDYIIDRRRQVSMLAVGLQFGRLMSVAAVSMLAVGLAMEWAAHSLRDTPLPL
jgi:hypothetical protein